MINEGKIMTTEELMSKRYSLYVVTIPTRVDCDHVAGILNKNPYLDIPKN